MTHATCWLFSHALTSERRAWRLAVTWRPDRSADEARCPVDVCRVLFMSTLHTSGPRHILTSSGASRLCGTVWYMYSVCCTGPPGLGCRGGDTPITYHVVCRHASSASSRVLGADKRTSTWCTSSIDRCACSCTFNHESRIIHSIVLKLWHVGVAYCTDAPILL